MAATDRVRILRWMYYSAGNTGLYLTLQGSYALANGSVGISAARCSGSNSTGAIAPGTNLTKMVLEEIC